MEREKLPSGTRYLGNKNTTEVHDLNNEQTNCQISEIEDWITFSSLDEAHDAGYDNCAYCIGGSTR